mmetsp:Transcript_78716/g.139075  ORF Transcript_78716/g.139075 Transcript_78716/m.139075 type:complete len:133 (-) Transcript_78716:2854-3252(-)
MQRPTHTAPAHAHTDMGGPARCRTTKAHLCAGSMATGDQQEPDTASTYSYTDPCADAAISKLLFIHTPCNGVDASTNLHKLEDQAFDRIRSGWSTVRRYGISLCNHFTQPQKNPVLDNHKDLTKLFCPDWKI